MPDISIPIYRTYVDDDPDNVSRSSIRKDKYEIQFFTPNESTLETFLTENGLDPDINKPKITTITVDGNKFFGIPRDIITEFINIPNPMDVAQAGIKLFLTQHFQELENQRITCTKIFYKQPAMKTLYLLNPKLDIPARTKGLSANIDYMNDHSIKLKDWILHGYFFDPFSLAPTAARWTAVLDPVTDTQIWTTPIEITFTMDVPYFIAAESDTVQINKNDDVVSTNCKPDQGMFEYYGLISHRITLPYHITVELDHNDLDVGLQKYPQIEVKKGKVKSNRPAKYGEKGVVEYWNNFIKKLRTLPPEKFAIRNREGKSKIMGRDGYKPNQIDQWHQNSWLKFTNDIRNDIQKTIQTKIDTYASYGCGEQINPRSFNLQINKCGGGGCFSYDSHMITDVKFDPHFYISSIRTLGDVVSEPIGTGTIYYPQEYVFETYRDSLSHLIGVSKLDESGNDASPVLRIFTDSQELRFALPLEPWLRPSDEAMADGISGPDWREYHNGIIENMPGLRLYSDIVTEDDDAQAYKDYLINKHWGALVDLSEITRFLLLKENIYNLGRWKMEDLGEFLASLNLPTSLEHKDNRYKLYQRELDKLGKIIANLDSYNKINTWYKIHLCFDLVGSTDPKLINGIIK